MVTLNENDRHKSITADVAMYTCFPLSRGSSLSHITDGSSQGDPHHYRGQETNKHVTVIALKLPLNITDRTRDADALAKSLIQCILMEPSVQASARRATFAFYA